MSATAYDLDLIQRCLMRDRQAWEAIVDRSLRIVVQVVRHTGKSRQIAITRTDLDDLVAEVFLELCKNDFSVLRRFQGQSSFTTYLTVVARRVVVRNLVKRPLLAAKVSVSDSVDEIVVGSPVAHDTLAEVTELLEHLTRTEAELVRLHHLEGCSYEEISHRLGMSANSVGPALSRAREKMRQEHERQEIASWEADSSASGANRRAA